jgi:serum/glucocorticoid-regulated kinase 2
MWTGFMTKINKRMKTQVRKFTLTNQRFINFGDNKLKAKVMSLFKGSKIKREVDIKKITHITYSENSN